MVLFFSTFCSMLLLLLPIQIVYYVVICFSFQTPLPSASSVACEIVIMWIQSFSNSFLFFCFNFVFHWTNNFFLIVILCVNVCDWMKAVAFLLIVKIVAHKHTLFNRYKKSTETNLFLFIFIIFFDLSCVGRCTAQICIYHIWSTTKGNNINTEIQLLANARYKIRVWWMVCRCQCMFTAHKIFTFPI